MDLRTALEHARDAKCEAVLRGSRIRFGGPFGWAQCWYPDEARWGRVEWNISDILATDWTCSDGYTPPDPLAEARALLADMRPYIESLTASWPRGEACANFLARIDAALGDAPMTTTLRTALGPLLDTRFTADGTAVYDQDGEIVADCAPPSLYAQARCEAIAQYIAACSPEVVRALIEERDRLRAEVNRCAPLISAVADWFNDQTKRRGEFQYTNRRDLIEAFVTYEQTPDPLADEPAALGPHGGGDE